MANEMVGKWMCVMFAMLSGCATTQEMDTYFPSRAELDELLTLPRAKAMSSDDIEIVERWTFQTPQGSVLGSSPSTLKTTVDRFMLTEVGDDDHFVVTEQLKCFAKEIGAFRNAHPKTQPINALERAMARHCGVIGLPVHRNWHIPADKVRGKTDREILRAFEKALRARLERRREIDKGKTEVALALVREDTKGASIVLVNRSIELQLDALPTRLEPGRDEIVVRGRIVDDRYGSITGSLTFGTYEMERCVPNLNIKAPQFEMRCPFHVGDAQTRVVLSGSRKDLKSNWGYTLEGFRVFGASRRPKVWTLGDRVAHDESNRDPRVFARRLLAKLNEVRALRSLPSLREAKEQSKLNQRLFAGYAQWVGSEEVVELKRANRLLLGMAAAREIDAPLVDYNFNIRYGIPWSADLAFESLIESPNTRRALLDGRTRHITISSLDRGRSQTIAVFFYTEHRPLLHAGMANQVLRALNERRAEQKRRPVRWQRNMDTRGEALMKQVWEEGGDADAASASWSNKAVDYFNLSTMNYRLYIRDIRQIRYFQDALVNAPGRPRAAVFVTPYRVPGNPFILHRITITVPQKDLK